jgi:DNA-binding MurR/RpiR family transcriptional regulator
MDIISRIQSQYDTFNKTQRRIADYLLQHPDTSCFSSLRQLATAASTTEATILSFSRRIGFANFVDMRSDLQDYISQWMSPNEKIKKAILSSGGKRTYSKVIDTESAALQNTFRHISEKDFQETLRLLRNARRVFLLSYDYATTVSNLFMARFLRLGVDVMDLGGKSLPDILYHLAMIAPEDLVVLFSYAPYTSLPIALVQQLHNDGAPVVCFSDSASSPAAQCADVTLTSVTENAIFLNSMTAPVSLVNLMASVYVTQNQERFNAFSARLAKLQEIAKHP